MQVIHPRRYQPREQPKQRRRWPYALLVLVLAAGIANYLRPLPAASVTFQAPKLPVLNNPNVAWPASGQTALGADGYGVLATSGAQTPIATASIAKVITALCVLQKLPLSGSQSGPTYTIGQNDIAIYNNYLGQNASLIPVAPGEQLTERQALEALLIPSANNLADSLASWVFKSQDAYAVYASQFLLQHGITHTHIGSDASGFDPSTTSTASDLVRLGLLAQQNPVLMSIAGQQSVDLPVVGTVYNYDTVLGQNGITGLKTGNSTADLGAFLFTADAIIHNQTVRIVGAILGQGSLNQALSEAVNLVGTTASGFTIDTIVPKATVIASVHTVWGTNTVIRTTRTIGLLRWQGTPLTQRHTLHTTGGAIGTVGALEVSAGDNGSSSPLAISHPATLPSFWWRLSRH